MIGGPVTLDTENEAVILIGMPDGEIKEETRDSNLRNDFQAADAQSRGHVELEVGMGFPTAEQCCVEDTCCSIREIAFERFHAPRATGLYLDVVRRHRRE